MKQLSNELTEALCVMLLVLFTKKKRKEKDEKTAVDALKH